MKLPLKWIPAKAFGALFKRPAPAFVVVHSTESENTPAIAESLAGPNWFGGPKAGTSTHKIVDQDSICEGVKRDRVAYHAGPGGNSYGIAYEFCGRASWSAAKWREPAQLQMLRNAAPHIADDLIAITGSLAAARSAARWLSLVQVARNEHGLCTHNDIRLAKGGTTHSDPGANFPYAELLAFVRAELDGGTQAPIAPPRPSPPIPVEDFDMFTQIDPGQTVRIPVPSGRQYRINVVSDSVIGQTVYGKQVSPGRAVGLFAGHPLGKGEKEWELFVGETHNIEIPCSATSFVEVTNRGRPDPAQARPIAVALTPVVS